MNSSLLVRMAGFPATLIHGDPLVLDRWLWLRARLPKTRGGDTLLDVGCGSGAFSIGASLRGYRTLGLSWDERNQHIASERATICGARNTRFEILDIRRLDKRSDLRGAFDVAICFEAIEHILDDLHLIKSIGACLKPGGRLLLTTPYLLYRPISAGDAGPFSSVEDGGHVRRGYTRAMLEELCDHADLAPEEVSFCSGLLSQKLASLQRLLTALHPIIAWFVILPLRPLVPLLDPLITNAFRWPRYSICLEAYKRRYGAISVDD